MNKSKFEISKESGQHLRLARLVGNWGGTTQTWFEADVLADESPMRATASLLMEGRFLNLDYEGTLNGKPFEGKMIWSYDLGNERCQCSWIDTFHMGTAIMHSEGSEKGNGFVVTGQYGWAGIPAPWSWRTELEIINSEEFILRAYNISPEGEEAKATETVFNRIKL